MGRAEVQAALSQAGSRANKGASAKCDGTESSPWPWAQLTSCCK